MQQDQDKCPTHNVEMEYVSERQTQFGNVAAGAYVCDECRRVMFERITTIKFKMAEWKNKGIFRGL